MEGFAILLVVGGAFALLVRASMEKAKRLAAAKADYEASLGHLKKDPTNADLKQRTLAFGRKYSNLTRDSKGTTLFDEVALSNDIGAACAAASKHVPVGNTASLDSRLARLDDLKHRGQITGQEYDAQRARILQEL